MEEGSIF